MKLDDAIKLGLGLHVSEWASLRTCEEALRVMAEVLELQRTQEAYAIVERVHGQMVLRFTNGQVLQQVEDGTKLYRLQTLPSDAVQKTKYDWSQAPDWVQWIATDKNGIVFGFTHAPIVNYELNFWECVNVDEEYDNLKSVKPYIGDWMFSSEKRPQRRSHTPTGEAKHAATTGQQNTIRDYAIWQAITDLESRCRHRASGLQIEIEDREHSPVVQYALEVLEECGVEIIRDARYPNIKINYDRSTNKFFGKHE